jgi:protocatechuate 3,4-dioxygenase beta subunit
MSRLACWLLLAASAQAAAIRGIVLDHSSGRPVARAIVTLQAVQGSGAAKASIRTGSSGSFVFSSLTTGVYLLSASRPGFAVLKYGQKKWNTPGMPIQVAEESAPFLDLRLHRLGAVTGVVWDENEIGIPEQEVLAYRNTRPPTLAARGRTDERGVYRIGGLEPGQYLIRSGAKELDEETGVVPTFYKDATAARDARTVDVELDQQAAEINVRPVFGKLLKLTGAVYGIPMPGGGPVQVTLISDMGQTSVMADGYGRFGFSQLAPGNYELVAEASQGRRPSAAFRSFFMDRDVAGLPLQLGQIPSVQISIQEQQGRTIDPRSITVLARRKDLSGEGATLRLQNGAPLLPGRWDIAVAPTAEMYPVSIAMQGADQTRAGRADTWNEYTLSPRNQVDLTITISSGAAAVHGKVTRSINEPAPGAPVYLEAFDPATGQRLAELRQALTNARGEYGFSGLTPGSYRIVSSFEFDEPDERTMEAARAKLLAVKAGSDSVQELELYTGN